MFDKFLRSIAQNGAFGGQLHAPFDSDVFFQGLKALGVIVKTVSINPPSIATGAIGQGTVAVAGLTPAHKCIVMGAAAPSVAVAPFGARCAAAGTLTVDFVNPSAGTLDAAVQNFTLLAFPVDIN